MRKALVLLVVVAAGAVASGLVIGSPAVKAGASTLSAAELNRELTVISKSPGFTCYLEARQFVTTEGQVLPPVDGASSQAWSTGPAVQWADLRATELVLDSYVEAHNPAAFSVSAIGSATKQFQFSIGAELAAAKQDGAQSSTQLPCVSSLPTLTTNQEVELGSTVLSSLPKWFAAVLVRGEAGALGLRTLVAQVPTSGPGLQQWYGAHSASFDTTCLSDLVVATEAEAQSIVSEIDAGLSIATAVHRYSEDPTQRKKGGSIGCFSPNDLSQWPSVVEYVGSLKIGQATVVQGQSSWYVIGPTKRTPNPFASIAKAVAGAANELNVEASQNLATSIQANADISVSPTLGTWVTTSLGGTITAPSTPPPAAILNPAANAPAS